MPLPAFPEFKKLTLSDKKGFENITKNYPPYSDYNFVSIWSYNTEDDVIVSLLNKNLVMRFRDYITNEPFYTFIGINKVEETIQTLITQSKKSKFMNKLQLIPEVNVKNNKEIFNKFLIREDRNNFDYIYLLEKMSSLQGSEYRKQRGWINKLLRDYPNIKTKEVDINDKKIQQSLLNLLHVWVKNKNLDNQEDAEHELIAISRLLKDSNNFNLTTLAIYNSGELIGFSISEKLPDNYSIMHFVKANTNYKGIYQLIYKETAKAHFEKDSKYLNREQDLGIPGLRESKESWNPSSFLKKYIISEK